MTNKKPEWNNYFILDTDTIRKALNLPNDVTITSIDAVYIEEDKQYAVSFHVRHKNMVCLSFELQLKASSAVYQRFEPIYEHSRWGTKFLRWKIVE